MCYDYPQMATYAIGDIQGCYDSFRALLSKLEFLPGRDKLWLVGDMVNRGPKSLDTLRWLVAHSDDVVAVLGNHDLHLIECWLGISKRSSKDTFQAILEAFDGGEMIAWLCERPFLHRTDDWVMVHAGILPAWSLEEGCAYGADLTEKFRSTPERLLANWRAGSTRSKSWGTRWHDRLTVEERDAVIMNAFTRMRICNDAATIDLTYTGPLDTRPVGGNAWFEFRSDVAPPTILYGHWAAIGLHRAKNSFCIDSGCVWGDALTALRLDDGAIFQQPAVESTGEG